MENTVKINLENLKGTSYNDKYSLANDDYRISSYELDMLVDLLDEKEDSDNFLKNIIAGHRNTSAETLDRLSSKDEHFIVREHVAKNKNTSAETLDKLSKDEHPMVRENVAKNKNTTAETLDRMQNVA